MAKITNEMRYKTAEERVKAFDAWCRKEEQCKKCGLDSRACAYCFNRWLAFEAEEEKPENCPFCGGKVIIDSGMLRCDTPCCGYRLILKHDPNETIAAHNSVARAVRAARESEVR